MATLVELRKKIKKIDEQIIKKLAERQKLSKKIGAVKNKIGKEITDPAREKNLMNYYEDLSDQYDLQSPFIKRLFKIIIIHSRKLQK